MLQLENGNGAGATMGDELLDTGLTNADQGKFSRDKETGGQDEEGYQNDAEENPFKHLMS